MKKEKAMPAIFDRRNRSGRSTSTTINVPSNASGRYKFAANMTQADLDDPSVAFAARINVFDPATSQWNFDAGITFQGGPNQGKNGTPTQAPGFIVNAAEYAGRQVQVELVVTGTVRLGIDHDILSPA